MWEDTPLHKKMSVWSYCSQKTIFPARKTKKIETGSLQINQSDLNGTAQTVAQILQQKIPRLHSEAATDNPETIKLAPIPGIVWQQRQENHSIDIHENSTTTIKNSILTPEFKRRDDVESRASPIREASFQVSRSITEFFLDNQTKSTPLSVPLTPRNNRLKSNELKLT